LGYPKERFIEKLNSIKLTISFSLTLIGLVFIQSCGVYSFTGSTLGPDVKTISIQTFTNNALLGPSNMSVTFTEEIKDYFQQNTGLILVDQEGDIQLEGYIENYTLTPVAASASSSSNDANLANQSRITISISAVYINTKDDQFDFDRRFSNFRDFDQATTDLSQVEEQLVDEIFEQIIIDIFNSSVANW